MSVIAFYWFSLIIFSIMVAFFTSWLAKTKGYNEAVWFFLGLFFSVIALWTMMGAPKKTMIQNSKITKKETDDDGLSEITVEKGGEIENSSEKKTCKHIGETGKFCTKCGERLTPPSVRF